MSDWKKVRLGEIAKALRVRVDPSDLGDTMVVHFSIPAFDARRAPTVESASGIRSHKFRVDEDSVLVSMLNPRIPRVWLASGSEDALASTEFAVLRPTDSRMSLTFLYCLCRSNNFISMLDERSTGTTGSRKRSKAADALAYTFSLPPLPVQERIAEVIGAVDAQILALQAEVERLRQSRAALLARLLGMQLPRNNLAVSDHAAWMQEGWIRAPLKRFLTLDVESVNVDPEQTYPTVGVLNRGRGLLYRDPVAGSSTSYRKLNRIGPRVLVYSRLKAFEGAITVTPDDLPESFASQEFPTFTFASDADPDFFRILATTRYMWDALQGVSKGMGGRRERVKPTDFLDIVMDIPPLPVQERIVEVIGVIDDQIAALSAETARLGEVQARLLSGLLDRTIDIESAELEV